MRQDYQLGNQTALVGTDIVPTYFPMPETLAKGFEFGVQSITAPWPDADKSSFDLVHQRMALFATGAELEAAVAGLIDLVKPGGWIQMVDADLTVEARTSRWCRGGVRVGPWVRHRSRP
jgi:hypothetical protein